MLRHDNLCKTNDDLTAMLSVASNSHVVTGLVQPAVDPNDRYNAPFKLVMLSLQYSTIPCMASLLVMP